MRNLALAAIGLGVLGTYAIAVLSPAVGLFHDDGIYLVTAKALADGSGYRLISLPQEIPQTKYPVLFPWLLSLVWRAFPSFPENLPWLRLLPFASALIWWWLAYRLLRQESSRPWVAAGIVGITAAAPWVYFLSTALLAETMFAAFSFAALLELRRAESGETPNRGAIWAGIWSGCAFLSRASGLPLLMAAAVSFAWRRQFKALALYGLASGAFVVPWFAWVWSQREALPAQLSYYTHLNYQSWNTLLNYSWEDKITVFLNNLVILAGSPSGLLQFLPQSTPGWMTMLPGLLVGIGFVRSLARGVSSLHWFFLFSVAMTLTWAWPPMRFMAPLLPLLLYFIWMAVERRAGGGRLPKALVTAFGLVVVVGTTWALATHALRAREQRIVLPYPTVSESWDGYRSLLSWVKDTAEPGSVPVGNLDPLLFLYTGHKAVRPFDADPLRLFYSGGQATEPLGTIDELLHFSEAVSGRYLVVTPDPGLPETPHIRNLLAKAKGDATRAPTTVYYSGGGRYLVEKLLPVARQPANVQHASREIQETSR